MATPSQVTGMQTILQQSGRYHGPINGDPNNPEYVNALSQWQREQGLTASGSYDLATDQRLAAFFKASAGVAQAPAADVKVALERYGASFGAYINHPEIGPLLIKGAKEGWDPNYLKGQIQQTEYWRMTEASQRNWEEMKTSDPGGAQRMLDESMAYVINKTKSMGLDRLTDPDIRRLAEDRISFGWTQDEAMFNDVLVGMARQSQYQGQELVGDLGNYISQLKTRAASQLLALDDNAAYDYALRIYSGEATLDGYDSLFRTQAKAMAPWAAAIIDDGVLLADVFEQHKQRISSELELAPDQIDFINDPTWRQVVNFADPKSGQVRAMTQNEAEILARQQTGFLTTNNANERAAEMSDFLSRSWGVRAPQ
jgi:hypothetical protein